MEIHFTAMLPHALSEFLRVMPMTTHFVSMVAPLREVLLGR